MLDTQMRIAVSPIFGIDFRDASATPDGSWTVSGYAAVFNQETTLYDGTYMTLRESIDPGAFRTVLASNPVVHLNLGHDMNRCVAATDVATGEIGALTLRTDDNGLFFMARVDKEDPDAVALCTKLARGIIKQASFAFTIGNDIVTETNDADGKTDSLRRIMEVKALYDVCCTPAGAYPQTTSMLRSMFRALGQVESTTGHARHLLRQGEIIVSGDTPGGVDQKQLRVVKARAAAARVAFLPTSGERR